MGITPKIGITGMPRVGKTEGLISVIKRLEDEYTFGGMITDSIEEKGERVGFKVMDWQTKQEGVFAHVDLDTVYRVGKYRIDLKVLEKIGVPAIERAVDDEDTDIVIIDEVGKMELESDAFRDAVRRALEEDKPLLLTLHKKSRDSLLQDIRNMDDVRILEITSVNRNILPYKIDRLLKEGMQ
ncbi:MAG: NTPase [Thermoplasmatota archaeon]